MLLRRSLGGVPQQLGLLEAVAVPQRHELRERGELAIDRAEACPRERRGLLGVRRVHGGRLQLRDVAADLSVRRGEPQAPVCEQRAKRRRVDPLERQVESRGGLDE